MVKNFSWKNTTEYVKKSHIKKKIKKKKGFYKKKFLNGIMGFDFLTNKNYIIEFFYTRVTSIKKSHGIFLKIYGIPWNR